MTTRLQQAAYDAQAAAGLPVSELARAVLAGGRPTVPVRRCAAYLHTVQAAPWFGAAFAAHTRPVLVVGGRGLSHADAETGRVKIGTWDRTDPGRCEQACLHELAHIVTSDHGPDRARREPARGPGSSHGHFHAWRANFVLIVAMTLGGPAASRLRHEFGEWGLPTRR